VIVCSLVPEQIVLRTDVCDLREDSMPKANLVPSGYLDLTKQ
jgi:hypothetical protein